MEENKKEIEVNGKKVSIQELQELEKNPSIRLKKLSEGIFKTLQRLHG